MTAQKKNKKFHVTRLKKNVDETQIQYLLSLNCVFDISKTRITKNMSDSHYLRPKIWCWNCWINLFHLNKRGRIMRQMERNKKKLQNHGSSSKNIPNLICWASRGIVCKKQTFQIANINNNFWTCNNKVVYLLVWRKMYSSQFSVKQFQQLLYVCI